MIFYSYIRKAKVKREMVVVENDHVDEKEAYIHKQKRKSRQAKCGSENKLHLGHSTLKWG